MSEKEEREVVPFEAEIDLLARDIEAGGGDVATVARNRADAAIAIHNELMRATVAMTLPQDWLRHGDYYFLQTAGCERVAPLWGVDFEKVDLRTDCELSMFTDKDGDDHVQWTVALSASSRQTRRVESDINEASSADGFFLKRWVAAKDNPVERQQISNDIRKAAITHCRGRVIRTLLGLNRVTDEWLAQHGLDLSKTSGVDYQKGSKGGESQGASSNAPNEGQQKKLAFELSERCEDMDYGAVLKLVKQSNLTRTTISKKIDALKDVETLTSAQVRKGLGLKQEAQAKKQEQPARAPVDSSVACPGCERSWDIIESHGHRNDCTEANAGEDEG